MWNLFGRKKRGCISKCSDIDIDSKEPSYCPEKCDCSPEDVNPCTLIIENIETEEDVRCRRKRPPQLGLNRSGRPVVPHRCEFGPDPSSTSVRSKSPSLFSLPFRKSSRPSVKRHSCLDRASSSTSGHDHEHFKSPTAPKYRPTVKPHHCFDSDSLTGNSKDSGSGSSSKARDLLKWFLLALMLIGVAGTAAGPMLLRYAKNKCRERNPCRK